MSRGHWTHGEKPKPDEAFGFVYEITNKKTGRKYIGKKQYRFKRGKRWIPSDWKTYTGSSESLNRDIESFGKRNFTFRILSHHKSKSALAYAEVKTIILSNALLSDDYYNYSISGIRFKIKVEPSLYS